MSKIQELAFTLNLSAGIPGMNYSLKLLTNLMSMQKICTTIR